MSVVAWHDVECGTYAADLPLWRELAVSPVLDVGAGTGRVALDLARRRHSVTALDNDPDLLGELDRRAGGSVTTVCADARDFSLDTRFASILVPMQTIQLLGERAGFLRCAREHLEPGGLLAVALAGELEPFEGPLPQPDVIGRYVSQPTAVRVLEDRAVLERRRDDGDRVTTDVIELHHLTADELEREAAHAGLSAAGRRTIDPTPDHVGTTVVLLNA